MLDVMHFAAFLCLSLPILGAVAAEQDSPLEQAKIQAQYWFDKISSYIPNPNKQHPVDAAAAAAGSKTIDTLSLNDWKATIRSSVKPTSTAPEEWWILFTGGNKTCYGLCGGIEKAFNESAFLFAADPTAPHMAEINCDNQPVLCNSWGGGPPSLWILQVLPEPAPVDIRTFHLNTTTTTVQTFKEYHATGSWKAKELYEGYFHPFDGPLAKLGLAVPIGYFFWIFAVIPSWLFMIGVSFLSRSIMGRRATPPSRTTAAAPAPAAAH